MRYAVLFEKTATGYSAYIPDLSGCVAAGAKKPLSLCVKPFRCTWPACEKTATRFRSRLPSSNSSRQPETSASGNRQRLLMKGQTLAGSMQR